MNTTTPPATRRGHHPDICAAFVLTLIVAIPTSVTAAHGANGIRVPASPVQSRESTVPGRNVYPAPIQSALDLLQWDPHNAPLIAVVELRPANVNASAEGWIVRAANGSALPTIYVAGWSVIYRAALANGVDARRMIVLLAGVLAHERTHIDHGPDEEGAYAAQLLTLQLLSAPDIDSTNVRRAMNAVGRQQRTVR